MLLNRFNSGFQLSDSVSHAEKIPGPSRSIIIIIFCKISKWKRKKNSITIIQFKKIKTIFVTIFFVIYLNHYDKGFFCGSLAGLRKPWSNRFAEYGVSESDNQRAL